MRKMLVLVAAAGVLVLALNATAAADSAYHTERLALSGVSGAPGSGMVVNAHANGPNVYAHEIYTLRHAVPGTYQVVLNIYATSLSCDGTPIEIEAARRANLRDRVVASTRHRTAPVYSLSTTPVEPVLQRPSRLLAPCTRARCDRATD